MPDHLGQTTVALDGTATVTISHQKTGIIWEVEQVAVVTAQVSSSTTASIFLNGNLVAPSAALTPLPTGQGTAAGGVPYLYLRATDQATIRIQAAIPGDVVQFRAQYREYLDTDPEMEGR